MNKTHNPLINPAAVNTTRTTAGWGANQRVRQLLNRLGVSVIAALLAATPLTSRAGDLQLTESPLFLANSVQPNIFGLLDDSGSMDWGILVLGSEGRFEIQGQDTFREYVFVMCQRASATNNTCISVNWDNHRDWNNASGRILPSEAAVVSTFGSDPYGVWRGRFSGYNVIYYKPDVVYTPWAGEDDSMTAFGDVDPAAAPLDPFKSSGITADLTAAMDWVSHQIPNPSAAGVQDITVTGYYPARYYTWTDSDTDGVVDATDAHTLYEIRGPSDFSCSGGATCPASFTRPGTRVDCGGTGKASVPVTCTRDQELQNFANWFSYFHRRELIVKKAGSEIIDQSRNRLGLSSLHNNENIGTPIQDIDNITLPFNPAAQANKDALIRNLHRAQSAGGTPMRLALKHAGQYYEGDAGVTWQMELFNGSPGHDTNETISALSPILNATNGGNCQQNFTILLSDGFWNGASPALPGNGNADDDGDSPNTSGNTPFDGGPYEDTGSDTLADVAMYYYERDLRDDLDNNVPIVSSVDNNTGQHMSTYTVAFGLEGSLDPFDTKTPGDPSDTDPNDPGFNWPTPPAAGNDPRTLDDMWHAAYNGRGEFLSAGDPGQLVQSVKNAIASISGKVGTAASVAATSGVLTANSRVYQAKFKSGEWSGDLRSVQLDLAAGQLGTEDWSAGEILKDPTLNRVILTMNSSTRLGVAFDYDDLSTGAGSQQEMLDTNPATGGFDGLGSERVSFLRGDHGLEAAGGGTFRDRANSFVLGDIINSGPVFVGAPPFLYPDDLEDPTGLTNRYSEFRGDKNSRAPVVYVGANDGMLHGFNATTGGADSGKEVLAYVPTSVYSRLNQLTDPGYNHRYYVDGSPTYGDAFFNSDNEWHSVIVGTLAGGGQGVFALDVTDPSPSSFDEINASQIVLWEFTDADDVDLGFTYGPAVIAKTHAGAEQKWAAFFGNGYNNTVVDGNASTGVDKGEAFLFVVDIEDGSVIAKIPTGANAATSADGTTPNGLATPAVIDADGDFVADFVLAGDLQGNMWKFDVRGDPTGWGVTDSVPLFTATDGLGAAQPIIVQPEVINHPTGEGGFMVYFGTGKYIEDGDNAVAGSQEQTFYGVWDEIGSGTGTHSTVSKSNLQTQTLSTDTTASGDTVRVFLPPLNQIDAWGTDPGEHMGWRVDLPDPGERNVTNPVALGERILFTTLIPLESPCEFGGTGFLMELSIVDGGPPPAPVFDIDNDGVVDDTDVSSGGHVVVGVNPDVGLLPQPARLVDPASRQVIKVEAGTKDPDTGALITNAPTSSLIANRRSWRQLK